MATVGVKGLTYNAGKRKGVNPQESYFLKFLAVGTTSKQWWSNCHDTTRGACWHTDCLLNSIDQL